MPPFVLTVLKVVFLALLYFFIYRTVRTVVVDLRTGSRQAPTPRAARPKAGAKSPRSLTVLDERGTKVNTVPLDGQINIGRGEACQVQVQDTYVSTFHAKIYSRDGSWFVEDLGSTNGTYVNQRRVTAPTEIRVGDTLRVGKTTLEVRR